MEKSWNRNINKKYYKKYAKHNFKKNRKHDWKSEKEKKKAADLRLRGNARLEVQTDVQPADHQRNYTADAARA